MYNYAALGGEYPRIWLRDGSQGIKETRDPHSAVEDIYVYVCGMHG